MHRSEPVLLNKTPYGMQTQINRLELVNFAELSIL